MDMDKLWGEKSPHSDLRKTRPQNCQKKVLTLQREDNRRKSLIMNELHRRDPVGVVLP